MDAYIDCDTTNETFEQLARRLIVISDDSLAINSASFDVISEPLSGCDAWGWLAIFKKMLVTDAGKFYIRIKVTDVASWQYSDCVNSAESIESLFKRLIEVDASGNTMLRVGYIGGVQSLYTSCENADESWEVLFRKMIYTTEDGILFLNIIPAVFAYDLYFDCTTSDTLINVFKKCVYINLAGDYALLINT